MEQHSFILVFDQIHLNIQTQFYIIMNQSDSFLFCVINFGVI